MSEPTYNPDDPAFLASRSLDEDLPESEQRRLDHSLSVSDSLRREAEQLRVVDQLVKRSGAEEVDIDWDAYADLVVANALAGQDEEGDGKLDDLLERWGSRQPEADSEAFTAAVMARIEPKRRRLRPNLIYRIGAPLAAAAAVALAVTASFWVRSLHAPVSEVVIGRLVETVASAPSPPRTAVVSFRREPAEAAAQTATPGISFMAFSAIPAPKEWSDEAPPA